MDRAPLGLYFYTCWRENGKLFATRHDFPATATLQAKKAHDGAMTYLWAQRLDTPHVSGIYNEYHRMQRHGSRQGQQRPTTYEATPMPPDIRADCQGQV
jgi:hypothetical protein